MRLYITNIKLCMCVTMLLISFILLVVSVPVTATSIIFNINHKHIDTDKVYMTYKNKCEFILLPINIYKDYSYNNLDICSLYVKDIEDNEHTYSIFKTCITVYAILGFWQWDG